MIKCRENREVTKVKKTFKLIQRQIRISKIISEMDSNDPLLQEIYILFKTHKMI